MLVDSHCHLDFADFDAERDEIIKRAGDVGVGLMVTISTRVRQFERIRAITETYPNVFCSVGTHPHQAFEFFAKGLRRHHTKHRRCHHGHEGQRQ